MANDMLASTRGRALRTGSMRADLPVEVVLRIWRFVEVLEQEFIIRIQRIFRAVRRGRRVRQDFPLDRAQYSLRLHMLSLSGIQTFKDLYDSWVRDRKEGNYGLPTFWWRKWLRDVNTPTRHFSGISPTTTDNNVFTLLYDN